MKKFSDKMIKRYFSENVKKLIEIGQGGTIHINLYDKINTNLMITSCWQDHCEIECSEDDLVTNIDYDKKSIQINSQSNKKNITNPIKITIPEIFHVNLKASDLQLKLSKKILGDVSIQCNSGFIEIDKLKGENISLDCGKADIKINTLVEGIKNSINSRKLNAQMINGKDVSIKSIEDAKIEAIYSDSTTIKSDSLFLNLAFGKTSISTNQDVTVNNIDGSFGIVSNNGNVSVQINKLFKGSISSIDSINGSVIALIDPELITSITCDITNDDFLIPLISPSTSTQTSSNITELSSNNSKNKKLTIKSDAFHGFIKDDTHATGYFSGESEATKRPEFDTKSGKKSGKIDLSTAEKASLHRSNPKIDNFEEIYRQNRNQENSDETPSPDITIRSKNSIRVETLSWIGRIRQKYGFYD